MKRYKLNILLFLILMFCLLLTACGKTKEAKAVDSLILSIGELKDISEENITEVEKAVSEAESAYNALSEEDQKSLDHYEVLVESRQELESVKENLVKEAIDKIEKAFQSGNYNEMETIVKGLSDITLDNSREQLMKKFSDMGDKVIYSLDDITSYLDEETVAKACSAIDSIVNAANELHIDQADSLYAELELLSDEPTIVRTSIEYHDMRVMADHYNFETMLENFFVGFNTGDLMLMMQAQMETEVTIRQINYQGSYMYAKQYVDAANTLNQGMNLFISSINTGSSTSLTKGAEMMKEALSIFTELDELIINANLDRVNHIRGN